MLLWGSVTLWKEHQRAGAGSTASDHVIKSQGPACGNKRTYLAQLTSVLCHSLVIEIFCMAQSKVLIFPHPKWAFFFSLYSCWCFLLLYISFASPIVPSLKINSSLGPGQPPPLRSPIPALYSSRSPLRHSSQQSLFSSSKSRRGSME